MKQIIEDIKEIGVENIAPCHCTGLEQINQFREAFDENFFQVGVGKVIELEL